MRSIVMFFFLLLYILSVVKWNVVDVYRKFAKFPQTVSATLSASCCGDNPVIKVVQSQRDLERSEKIKFSKSYCLTVTAGDCKVTYRSNPQEICNELWNRESRSGKYCAIIRTLTDKKKKEDKQYIEIWDDSCKIGNYDVAASEKHGKIYDDDGCFGCFEWSPTEDKLLYIAEKKYKKAVSYFDKPSDDKEKQAKTDVGEEYVAHEDWGEGMVGKHHPVVCIITVTTGDITVLDTVPGNVSPALAKWCGDESVVFTGWDHDPYRLGLIYCPIRKSAIYLMKIESGVCETISTTEMSSRQCKVTPDKTGVVYLQNNVGGPHFQCSALMKYDFITKATTTVIKTVNKPEGSYAFPGLYTLPIPDTCWAADGVRMIVSSVWRSYLVVLVINTQTHKVTRLPRANDCIMSVLCTKDDLIVAESSSPNKPHHLVVGMLPSVGKEASITWCNLDGEPTCLENIAWKVNTHTPTTYRINKQFPHLDYESVLIYPTKMAARKKDRNLIVYPHSGPHTTLTPDFSLYVSLLCDLGFSTLMVNYRGSLGFGADSINSLPGHVGDQDVKDVHSAALEIIKTEGYNPDKVVVWGESHGGFLTCHLIGQYPGFYKAAVCRNPVINIATMIGSTDIPDWAYVESGLPFDFKTLPNEKVFGKMWSCSPLFYVDQISTPTMVMIGQDDRRAPTKQGYELYKALKARDIPVRYIIYPDNEHPIVKVDSEADAFVNIYNWFTQYLPAVK